MQELHKTPLGSIRAFEAAARHQSMMLAAAELGVTPGAVSHQVKKLEQSIGVRLFARRNNALDLTPAGQQLQGEAARALTILERAIGNLRRDDRQLNLRSGVSFATRWLVPRLERFKADYPRVRLKTETSHEAHVALLGDTDFAVTYERGNPAFLDAPHMGRVLCLDACLPLASPALMADAHHRSGRPFDGLPCIQSTANNWDWRLWAEITGSSFDGLNIAHGFDTDDAAILAAISGLGIVLASGILTRAELESGALVPVPGCRPVELGRYCLVSSNRDDRIKRAFEGWLYRELGQDPPGGHLGG